MMRSMFAGVSGLKAHQIRMDVIGNNIANVNTAGYKSSRATFQEMLSQTIRSATAPSEQRGGTNPQQVGLGTALGSIDVKHTQGNTQPTGYLTDLAIEGDGFFVLGEGENRQYTRAGIFGLDNGTDGNLVSLVNGQRVLGYLADDTGEINLRGQMQPLYISATESIEPRATTEIIFGGNLDQRYSSADDPVKRTVQVYDSLGKEQTIVLSFHRQGVDEINEWRWEASWSLFSTAIPAHDSVLEMNESYLVHDNGLYKVPSLFDFDGYDPTTFDPTDPSVTLVATSQDGRIWVDESGHENRFEFEKVLDNGMKLEATGSDGRLFLTGEEVLVGFDDDYRITFNADGSYSGLQPDETNVITFNPASANPLRIVLDFSQFTQYADTFTGKFLSQNGYQNGALESYAIDQNGIIVGSFSNGLTRNLGQIALARFTNPAGLERIGSTMFIETPNSGTAQIEAAGQPGYGTISPSSLEMSNVDLSEEFTEMIITQRGFQANSRIITSSDEMLQELVNLKR